MLALLPVLWLAIPAGTASAHATLLGTSPAAGYAVPTPPTELTLDFDEPIGIGAAPLSLANTTGATEQLDRAALSLGGRRLSASVPGRLPLGGYRVSWQVTASDGDVISGVFTFAVGTGAVPTGQTGASGTADPPIVIVLRWLLFAGLSLALGGLAGELLARRVAREAAGDGVMLRTDSRLPLIGALAGLVAAIGLTGQILRTGAAQLPAAEAIGFAMAAGLLVKGRHRLRIVTTVPLVLVVAAEGLRAHPHAVNPLWGSVLTVVHLSAVAVWIGALAHVLVLVRRWRDRAGWGRLAIYDYARVALVLVLVVVASGVQEAILLLPNFAALVNTSYGIVLLIKLAVVVAVLVLAALARRRVRGRGDQVMRLARVEALGLVAVLAVTAVLVSLPTPVPTTTDLAAPPPPVGLAVPVGTLAGQVTVTATASAGQFVVRLATPATEDSTASPTFQVSGQTIIGGHEQVLALRGCGTGCFLASVKWAAGDNQVQLAIGTPGWDGGDALLDIPWPPRTDPALLPAVLAAMNAVPELTLHEAVTSDYAGYPGDDHPLVLPGAQFIATEPYNSGGGSPVVLSTNEADTVLGLSFADGQTVQLVVSNDDHRILHEEYVSPNHLITRTFEYPGSP